MRSLFDMCSWESSFAVLLLTVCGCGNSESSPNVRDVTGQGGGSFAGNSPMTGSAQTTGGNSYVLSSQLPTGGQSPSTLLNTFGGTATHPASSQGGQVFGGTRSSSGGAQSGGGSNTSKGGKSGTGGNSVATGGNPQGGATTGNSTPTESPGCGSTTPAKPCDTSGSPCTLDVNGTERKFYVQLPSNYVATKAYPVVFQYHPLGGNAEQGMTMYGIRPKFAEAIYVTPDGLKNGQYQGYSNTNGEDEAMTRAIMTDIETKYCVDKSRYFATGFSFGGSMSFTAACNMSDVFRAIGAMAGAPISGATCTTKKPARPVAVWATHGTEDTALPISMAQPIIDSFVKNNGCSTTSHPVDPAPCVEFEGCTTGFPVIWCVREGDTHAIPSFAAAAISTFLQRF